MPTEVEELHVNDDTGCGSVKHVEYVNKHKQCVQRARTNTNTDDT